ncbi:MAG: histidine kinase [Vicinamibacterales bacterium]|nr:histidine kinase [Vicinamibacterales bacterium]
MNRHSIQARVLLLQGAGWVVSLLLIAGTGWLSVTEVRRQTREQRGQVARLVASALDRGLAADLSQVQRLSGALDFRVEDGAAVPAMLRPLLPRMQIVQALAVVGSDGRVYASEPTSSPVPGLTAGEVHDVLAHGQPVVRAPGDGDVVAVLVPLRDRFGVPAAVAVARVSREARGVREIVGASGAALSSPPFAAGALAAPLALLPWGVTIGAEAAGTEATLTTIRNTLLWLVPVLVALGALFAWGTAWSVRQPVLLLTAAAERMRSGDLTTPVPILPDDEVGRLGLGLEHLRETLHASLQTIARHHEELEQRVADRTRELDQACRRLNERDLWRAQVLRRVISAQEDERRRLARELHDDTCQSLAALSVSAEAAVADLAPGPARDRLLSVKALVDASLADLHRVIYDLRPSVLDDLGLVPAIRWLVSHRFARSSVAVRLEVDGLAERLPPEVETALFRVVQEALTNIERHAHAEHVLVQLSADASGLLIEIEDDGIGFDPASVGAPAPGGRGLGLLGLRERVELLGGRCEVDSTPGHGARIVVSVPRTHGVEEMI